MLTKALQASTSGVNQIVAGVAGKVIRVYAWSLSAGAAVNAKWQSSATPTDLTGLRYLGTDSAWDVPMAPMAVSGRTPYLQTLAGEDLQLNLSGAVAVGGFVCYEISPV